MKTFLVVVLSYAALFFCLPAFALECHTDLDCTTGNRCVKQGYDATGTCLESRPPSNPPFNPGSDTERRQGNPKGKICWSNKDCESGLECIMKSGQMYGTCR
jgi:hypothetical protein